MITIFRRNSKMIADNNSKKIPPMTHQINGCINALSKQSFRDEGIIKDSD
jgi:hypothetical protein